MEFGHVYGTHRRITMPVEVGAVAYDPADDHAAFIIGFGGGAGTVGSNHYRYPVPDRYSPFIRPHRAVVDAVRIFLLTREFYAGPDSFLESALAYFAACRAAGTDGTSPCPGA
ncbi:MAG: hypothetical protein PWP08_1220 [Methanofollis sp.]|nr:hypothetical protein [Methanofollis sp.]